MIKKTVYNVFNRMNVFTVIFVMVCGIAWYYGSLKVSSGLYDTNPMESRVWQMLFLAARLCVAASVSYYVSRFALKDIRPTDMGSPEAYQYMVCRAIIMSGAMIGAGLAV